jgi:hypothetical protein
MKLIALVSQPVQNNPKPDFGWFNSIEPFLTPGIVLASAGFLYNVLRNHKKDILTEVGEKIATQIGISETKLTGKIESLETKLTGKIDASDQTVEENTTQITRIVDDIKTIKENISRIDTKQGQIVTAIRIIAKIGDESPELVKKSVEEVLQ